MLMRIDPKTLQSGKSQVVGTNGRKSLKFFFKWLYMA